MINQTEQTAYLVLPNAPQIEGLKFRRYQGESDLPKMLAAINAGRPLRTARCAKTGYDAPTSSIALRLLGLVPVLLGSVVMARGHRRLTRVSVSAIVAGKIEHNRPFVRLLLWPLACAERFAGRAGVPGHAHNGQPQLRSRGEDGCSPRLCRRDLGAARTR